MLLIINVLNLCVRILIPYPLSFFSLPDSSLTDGLFEEKKLLYLLPVTFYRFYRHDFKAKNDFFRQVVRFYKIYFFAYGGKKWNRFMLIAIMSRNTAFSSKIYKGSCLNRKLLFISSNRRSQLFYPS